MTEEKNKHALACRSFHMANTGGGASPKRKGTENCRRGRPQIENGRCTRSVTHCKWTDMGNIARRNEIEARRGEVSATDEAGRSRKHIDLGEDKVVGEAVRDGLRVREVDRHGEGRKGGEERAD